MVRAYFGWLELSGSPLRRFALFVPHDAMVSVVNLTPVEFAILSAVVWVAKQVLKGKVDQPELDAFVVEDSKPKKL